MTGRFWLLGSHDDLISTGDYLSMQFAADLAERESSFRGGIYLRGSAPLAEGVLVQTSFEDEDGCLAEPDFPGYQTLIYVVQNAELASAAFQEDPRLAALRVEEL